MRAPLLADSAPAAGLSGAGLTIMILSVTGILTLLVWCYHRLLASAGRADEDPGQR